ncbi:hypothetical protein EUTSA_v10005666mg [Eutrema salsugineum]|uniref:Uncharacterized protein n=1 Tax=Eutrema salsugineum TaxID=72664 RepID=V4KNY1_EUTSA|nr:hypothetical protein EUTSA_v10005666mg [Eutrema salsugineum]
MAKYLALFSSLQRKKRRGKVGRKRRRVDVLVLPEEIPLELQIEIMARLPAKSLMRFKCLSKLCNLYLTVTSRPRQPRIYTSLVHHRACIDSTQVCHNPCESALLSLSSSSNGAEDDEMSLDQDLTLPWMGGHNTMVLRGLILNTVCRKACIYNPATRQSVTLPAIKSNISAPQIDDLNTVAYFLGHDPVLDQYKVVCTVATSPDIRECTTSAESEHWVFVLEAGGSWKRIEFDQNPHFPTTRGVCINGVIYYLASCSCFLDSVLVNFDVRTEEFNMIIDLPDEIDSDIMGLIEYGGKPAIFDQTILRDEGLVDLWELGDGGEWSKKSLVLQPCQMHLFDDDDDIDELVVESTTRNGEVFLTTYAWKFPRYVLYYDLQKNDIRKVTIRGIPDHWFGKPYDYYFYSYIKLMDKSESIMHLET